jgi:hypothetical protein
MVAQKHIYTADANNSAYQGQKAASGIEFSVRPGVLSLETVLVAVMTDGSYLLMAYPQREPAVLVAPNDAGSLREALAAAFGNSPGRINEPGTADDLRISQQQG